MALSDTDPLRVSFETLAHFYLGDTSVADTLRRVSDLAEVALPQTAMSGITMIVDGQPSTAVFTNEEAPEVDVSQYATGDGPCLEAFRTMKVVSISSTSKEDRFLPFCKLALEHGINSTLSLPLIVGDSGIGALNLYSLNESAYSEGDTIVGKQFAVQASVVLANSQAYWDAKSLNDHLSEALRSRSTIEQAKGILMSQSGVSADVAFTMLRNASQRENRKVREIAEDLVRRAEGGAKAPALPSE